MPSPAIVVRSARAEDMPRIREIDAQCFPPGRTDVEPAHPGELEGAFERGQLSVAERDGEVVGMLQTEVLNEDHMYLAALAVLPARQQGGVGAALVQRFIEQVGERSPRPSATTVTSPANVAMVSLLTHSGFVGTRGVADYFGEHKDRVYFQLKSRRQVADPDDRVLVPVGAIDHLFRLLETEGSAITRVVHSVQGDFYEVSTFEVEDRPGLRADETAVSTGEAGAVVAALTFLLGFSLTLPGFSEALRTFLVIATVLTVGAMQIYANASGSLSRLQDDNFAHHMKWGNLLLEFGGIYPLVVVLPAVFANASQNLFLSVATATAVSLLLVLYELSSFSISNRYARDAASWTLMGVTVLLPLAAIPLQALTGRDTDWVILTGVILLLRLAVLVPADRQELGVRMRPLMGRRSRVSRRGRSSRR